MNDDFYGYLVSTDEVDNFLGYEPRCPHCKEKLIPIIYGMVGYEEGRKAENGEIFLGGCMIEEDAPEYHCNNCRRSYSKDLKRYINEPNNFED